MIGLILNAVKNRSRDMGQQMQYNMLSPQARERKAVYDNRLEMWNRFKEEAGNRARTNFQNRNLPPVTVTPINATRPEPENKNKTFLVIGGLIVGIYLISKLK